MKMDCNEAIEILIEKQHEWEEYGVTDLAIEALEKQITNRWISVNEKQPEKYGTYLVAWRPLGLNADDIKRHTGKNLNHYYEILEFDPDDESGWVSSIEQCEKYVLLAWRELPEPYVD